MSNLSDFFPGAGGGGGGGGGGILKQEIVTSSGSLDFTSLGIADGALVLIYLVGGGGGSARRRQILPEYKMNRKPIKLNRSDLYEDIPNTKENFNKENALRFKAKS